MILIISLFIWMAIATCLFFLEDCDGIAAAWAYLGGIVSTMVAIHTGVSPAWTIHVFPIILLASGLYYSSAKAANSGIGIAISYLYMVLFALSFIITIPAYIIFS